MVSMEGTISILAPLAKAVVRLLSDEDLIKTNPGEPVLTSELLRLMHDQFPGWRVNHLYDRKESNQKRLRYPKGGVIKDAPIIPDIIVHKVGIKDNLLVVEAKRHPNRDDGDDVWKLEGLTAADGKYAYKLGVHLTFKIRKRLVAHCEVYSDGQANKDATAWLRDNLP